MIQGTDLLSFDGDLDHCLDPEICFWEDFYHNDR